MKKKGGKIEDDRFKHIATDPRFRGVPRSQRKIKIDNRFAGMFDDKRFKLKYVMDKRGRPIHSTTSEDLKKYYAVASSDSEREAEDDTVEHPNEDDDTVEGPVAKQKSKQLAEKAAVADDVSPSGDDDDDSEATGDSEDESEDESSESSDEEKEPERDLSRGIGNIETSSEEDESSEEEDEEAEELDGAVAWGELDRDAPQSDHVSRRLALCNMDWDKVRAQDLFVLLDSFKPPGGIVQRVSVYPSEFGKERMEHERVNGPAKLVEAAAAAVSKRHSSNSADEEGDAKKQREALRQYQLSRLRYYYAIAECDSVETADHLYKELDGREYESSGTCVDLRFVPDDMTFTEEPTSVADGLPDPQTYKPLNFVTSALQSVNVQLTWDEDDPRRSEAMQRAFKEDGDHDDLKVYLASSSSEEEEEEEEQQSQGGGKEKGKKASMEAQIQKYRDLLKSLDGDKKAKGDEKDEDKDDVEMEVTWNPGLNKQVEDMVRRKQEQPEGKTPFQEFLEKRKEKRKLKRSLNKNGPQKAESGEERDEADSTGEGQQPDQPFSDDELPSDVDLDDDFFKDRETPKPSNEGAKTGEKKVEDKTEDEETAKSKAELELLLMDEQNDGRHHFSLKKLLEENEAGKGSRKRKRKAQREQKAAAKTEKRDGDDFQVDLADARFSALYSSHHFNVDPTDPHFKKTKGMEAILTEKQRRRLEQPSQGNNTKTSEPCQSPASVPQPPPETEAPESSLPAKPSRQSLSSLASSVKLKVQQMKNISKK